MSYSTTAPLVAFIYEILNNHVPAGTTTKILSDKRFQKGSREGWVLEDELLAQCAAEKAGILLRFSPVAATLKDTRFELYEKALSFLRDNASEDVAEICRETLQGKYDTLQEFEAEVPKIKKAPPLPVKPTVPAPTPTPAIPLKTTTSTPTAVPPKRGRGRPPKNKTAVS